MVEVPEGRLVPLAEGRGWLRGGHNTSYIDNYRLIIGLRVLVLNADIDILGVIIGPRVCLRAGHIDDFRVIIGPCTPLMVSRL